MQFVSVAMSCQPVVHEYKSINNGRWRLLRFWLLRFDFSIKLFITNKRYLNLSNKRRAACFLFARACLKFG